MRHIFQSATSRRSLRPLALFDRLLNASSPHKAALLLFAVCCGVAVIGVLVIRDLRAANAEARQMYTGSVHGLERISDLQYHAQETRRATLYALSTTDRDLRVEYAKQARNADQRVTDGIAEYRNSARSAQERALGDVLDQDWVTYLDIRDQVLASISYGSTAKAVNLDLTRGVPAFERVHQDLLKVKGLYGEDASRREANLAASSRRSSYKLAGILCFTFLLSIAAVWAIQRNRMLGRMQLAALHMEFVASVSHELRTPLAVIRSAADNLADGVVRDTGAMRKYGVMIQQQSWSMADLIDQILLFASTEDGQNHSVLQPVAVHKIVDAVVSNTDALLKKEGFRLDLRVSSDLPRVMGDLGGISRCLQNLIGNAVKYGGRDRRITLKVTRFISKHNSPGEVCISVADRGIGIDSSEIPYIFDPFYRSPRVQAAQIHGTGLGLSLAKRIAESMGGRLTVVSQLSAGSTFTLHLQCEKGDEVDLAEALARPSRLSRT